MKFKYQNEHEQLTVPCPPTDHLPKKIDPVYRWVFEEMEDERNFLPQYHRNPPRFLNFEDIDKCKGMALSLFDNLDGALQRYDELQGIIGRKISRTLGTQIAEGVIDEEDGTNGESERLGHFSHHSSISASYRNKFKVIKKL